MADGTPGILIRPFLPFDLLHIRRILLAIGWAPTEERQIVDHRLTQEPAVPVVEQRDVVASLGQLLALLVDDEREVGEAHRALRREQTAVGLPHGTERTRPPAEGGAWVKSGGACPATFAGRGTGRMGTPRQQTDHHQATAAG